MKTIKKIILTVLELIALVIVLFCIFCMLWILIFSDSYTEWKELRMCNVVEYYLDEYDGISNKDLIKAFWTASTTSLDSKITYDSTMIEDCNRHYTWSYELTKKIGKEKTQIITDNHEYGFLMKDEMINYFNVRETYYMASDKLLTRIKAPILALSDVKNYCIQYRKEFALQILDDKENVSEYIDGYTVMDFINNYYGREFARCGKYRNSQEAFLDAYKNDYLSLDRHVTERENDIVAAYIAQTKYE